MLAYDKEVRKNCLPFNCGVDDLDDFFLNDADLYADELLGKTYCWVTTGIPHHIVALFTLANDSIKTKLISVNDKNRLQRNIVNPKRGRSYPAVLIGRLGVNRVVIISGSNVKKVGQKVERKVLKKNKERKL